LTRGDPNDGYSGPRSTGRDYTFSVAVTTERLILRQWRDEDREPFAALNADSVVMEFFARPLTRAESDASLDRLRTDIQRNGYGFWAVEVKDGPRFVGFVGLREVRDPLPFAPAHEAGWRLAREYWGRGYATEAGTAALAFGFDQLGLDEIVAYAVAENVRSRRVMHRLGMLYNADEDFDDRLWPGGESYRRHVVYRKRRPPD
jgi:RimJ/RimL family protein N-acetyltransferase